MKRKSILVHHQFYIGSAIENENKVGVVIIGPLTNHCLQFKDPYAAITTLLLVVGKGLPLSLHFKSA